MTKAITDDFDTNIGRVGKAVAQHHLDLFAHHLAERTGGCGHSQRDIDTIDGALGVIDQAEINNMFPSSGSITAFSAARMSSFMVAPVL